MSKFDITRSSLRVTGLLLACLSMGFIPANNTVNFHAGTPLKAVTAIPAAGPTVSLSLYEKLGLGFLGMSRNAFDYAMKGFDQLQRQGKMQNEGIVSIADFSLPSGKKRLFVIDMQSGRLLFHTYVSHGRNSGKAVATSFSNKTNSFKSSMGFFVTGNTYQGKHGYSLRLEGKEAGINNNALKRGIVIHSAVYANEQFVFKQGFIGRSLGCPAIPEETHRVIIETIKNGSCFFIYAADAAYPKRSKLI